MQRVCVLAAMAALLLGVSQASAQSALFDFEGGTDQGFGHKFSDDASESFPIVDIGGSMRLEVLRNGDFQEAEHATGDTGSDIYMALDAASGNEAGYLLSYDYYIDTSLGVYGDFLELGTYVNTGSGYYAQLEKEFVLDGAQLASGGVFSGTVSQTFADKGYDLPTAQTFFRLGLIVNGDGADATVYYDNIRVHPVPEPASIALLGLAVSAIGLVARRRR